ncbi:hypothetical protein OG417_50800 [Actinoallomurus sp. NBC_01490]|uniref:hypothetical protein n=1 Tax=Actinoallomurus sp. NBC_01490 TaxID=2903557 RepID=UPI002E348BCC|nr:hypothetical protein [Actinoallomurus sp. NBC_01490]
MKFEIVEQPGEARPLDDHAHEDSPSIELQESLDPIQGLKVGTAQLVSAVQAEAHQISECLAEMRAVAARNAAERLRRDGRPVPAQPPASFRAARFGRSSGDRPDAGRLSAGDIGSTE